MAKQNWKNQRELAKILFCGDKGRNRIKGASRPPDGRKGETKKAGPKERSVRLLKTTEALEK